jgi:CspA family cold shock protein
MAETCIWADLFGGKYTYYIYNMDGPWLGDMPQGTVKMFRTDKGFGFIAPDDGGADVYIHVSELEKTGISSLYLGQKVTFDVGTDPRTGKMRATNVHEV